MAAENVNYSVYVCKYYGVIIKHEIVEHGLIFIIKKLYRHDCNKIHV